MNRFRRRGEPASPAIGPVAGPEVTDKPLTEAPHPKSFNSQVAFRVYALTGREGQYVGETPSRSPLTIPPCRWWFVVPLRPVDMGAVRRKVEAHRIPGLALHATDADLEHLKGLNWLEYLDFTNTQVTDAGLEYLKPLKALKRLSLWGDTQVTDAGVEKLKKSLPNLQVRR